MPRLPVALSVLLACAALAAAEETPPAQSAGSEAQAGQLLLRQGLPAEALPYLEKAVRLEPGDPELLNWLGSAYADLGESARAVHQFQQAAALSPSSVWNRFYGLSLLGVGELDRARAALTACLSDGPLKNRGVDSAAACRALIEKIDACQAHMKRAAEAESAGRVDDAAAEALLAFGSVRTPAAGELLDRLARKVRQRKLGLVAAAAWAALLAGLLWAAARVLRSVRQAKASPWQALGRIASGLCIAGIGLALLAVRPVWAGWLPAGWMAAAAVFVAWGWLVLGGLAAAYAVLSAVYDSVMAVTDWAAGPATRPKPAPEAPAKPEARTGEPQAPLPRFAPAFRPKSAAELASLASDPRSCQAAVAEHLKAGQVQELLAAIPKDAPPVLCSYARAFLRAGHYDGANELLRQGSPLPSQDQAVFKALRHVLSMRRPGQMIGGPDTYAERLALANAFSKLGLHREALGMVDEGVLKAAANEETDSMVVAGYYKDAGVVAEFLDVAGGRRPPEFYSSFANAFHELGCHEAGLALLKRKPSFDRSDYILLVSLNRRLGTLAQMRPDAVPQEHRVLLVEGLLEEGQAAPALEALESIPRAGWKPREYGAALRAFLQLERPEEAGKVFAEIRGRMRLEDAPELHYYYALSCEKVGRFGQAQSIYQDLIAKLGRYKDAAVRLKNLEVIPAEEASRATTLFTTGAAAKSALAAEDKSAFIKSLEERERAGLIGERFFLLKPLGVGGMGVVYKARDLNMPRDVALKRLRGEVASDPRVREAFMEEARTLSSMSHPCIVVLLDIVEFGQLTYLVFEFVDGENISELLASKGRIEARECGRILRLVCGALAHAHGRGVVHRDIKPANIMLDRKGLVKVMDFGIAQHGSSLGTAFAKAGTPAYMAPEQHEGRAFPLSDLYALGASAYEMLTGAPPFHGGDVGKAKLAQAYAPLPADVPPKLARLVAQCLKADPAARPQSATALEQELSLAA
ncbi:MAG: protein kinase [Elusimicrobia bacterium]|nr:protein kinase [Elusimicrobiota bacterium]